jgi:capsular polysaccharide biosynthesis protein
MTVCNRLEETSEVHNINLKTMGSACDFEPGTSPEGSNSINFLEDNKTYVIMLTTANYHHFFLNLMMPALLVLKELGHKNLHFVLCNQGLKDKQDNFDTLIVELLQENQISYTEISDSQFDYMNAKNFIPINGSDIENGIPLLYDYLIDKYSMTTKTPNKKIYVSRKKYPSQDTRVDNEEVLENYFLAKGFQIVYPEDIATFKEQFELFNSCSTLAALSGSGITSLIFMQENQKIIEIVSELIIGASLADDGSIIFDYGTHDHYEEFSALKNHKYFSVQNIEKQAELIKPGLDEVFDSLGENF